METKSPQEVAALLGVDEVTIRRLRHKAGLPERKRGQGYTQDEIALLRAQQRYKVHRREPEEADPSADIAGELHASNAPLAPELPASTSQLTARYEQLLSPSWEISRTFETSPDVLSALAGIARQNDRIIAQNDRIEQRLLDLSAALDTLEGRLSTRASPHREATPVASQAHTGASSGVGDPDLAVTAKRPVVRPPIPGARTLRPGEAARLLHERHGANFDTARQWNWPASALASEEAAIRWALEYVSGDYRRQGKNWRWECDTPGCPCHQVVTR